MRRFSRTLLIAAILVCLSMPGSASAGDTRHILYDRDVRPILSEKCFLCHGQDSGKRMAGLRLDSFEDATADRGGHAALVPGHPEASAMYQRITAGQPGRRMPPVYSNRTLTPDQITILKRWIEEGGVYSRHWAFVPPQRPEVPKVETKDWAKQPIDAFVYQRLQEEGLHPNRAAEPATWLRRVSLDLIGLAPSPGELDSFTKDVAERGEAAYVAEVDRLLASPRYGERMALDWLDVARYADTHGFNNDAARSMWRWRDWVIQSFNRNLPYDRFIVEQLAGDLLPDPSLDQRIATGFLRNHVINSEGGIIDEEYRVEYVTDRVNTVSTAWLGLTMGCAHCHDHKFDLVTQRDHYRLFAFFNNVPEIGEDGRVANAVPMISAPTSEQQAKLHELESAVVGLTHRLQKRENAWNGQPVELTHPAVPTGQVLEIDCDSDGMFEKTTGVAGRACLGKNVSPKPETTTIAVSKRRPLTFSVWLRPDFSDTDVAILSNMDYATNSASTGYGKGLELRLVAEEMEFRFADRFPAYSIRVRSEGARISANNWHHLTVVYEGPGDKDANRSQAAWVRMFADGVELPTRVMNDGLGIGDEARDKPAKVRLRIGWDNDLHSQRYAGAFDELAIWPRAISPEEIAASFERLALPYASARRRAQEASPSEIDWLRKASLRATDAEFAREEQKLRTLRTELLTLRRSLPSVMVMEEMAVPRETHLLVRGVYDASGEKVEPGVPEHLLGTWPAGAPKNRLGLAQWLIKPDHPLTSRVIVNRFWQQLFGEGLVKTSDNFGMQGDWPTHPELLDWLAREFVDSGWNVKALMKLIVLSATYRQSSDATPQMITTDPENRLLARGPRFRLPAEIIRDQALEIAGLLKNRLGGPSVFPYQPEGLYKGIVVAANYPGSRYVESTGDDLYRRSIYTFWKRTVPHPTMTVFDAPDREVCVALRSITNTPLQALTLLDDPIFVEAARHLAERSIREGGSTPDARLAFMFRLATGRTPDNREREILRQKLDTIMADYRDDTVGARALVSVGASPRDETIPVGELAAYTAVANMILNLDEVITKG